MRETLVIAIVSVVISAAPARADDRVIRARRQVEAADIDYRLGRFGAALDEYTKAYQLYPVPPLLFNIGQCHRNLKDYAKAIFFYEGYLRDEPTAANRALVEDLIRESRAELDNPPPIAPPVIVPPTVPDPPAGPPQPVAPPPVDRNAIVPSAPPGDRAPGRSRVVPAVMLGGGVAVLASGGIFYYYGQKRGADEKFVYDDTRLLGGTMVALGAAAIVTGAVLWFRRPDHPAASVAVPVAVIGPDAGYLGWAGTF